MDGTLPSPSRSKFSALLEAARSLKSEIERIRDDLDRRRRLPPVLVERMRARA